MQGRSDGAAWPRRVTGIRQANTPPKQVSAVMITVETLMYDCCLNTHVVPKNFLRTSTTWVLTTIGHYDLPETSLHTGCDLLRYERSLCM